MKNYAEAVVFTKKSLEAFREARMVVSRIQSYNGRYYGSTEWIRCHEVARIVAGALKSRHKLTVVDGKYGSPRRDHSWLIYTESNHPIPELGFKCILDVYAMGRCPMVQIIDFGMGHDLFYEAGPIRRDIDLKFVRAEIARARQHLGC